MSRRRALVIVLLALAANALVTAPVHAGILAAGDAAELAQSLAEAQAEQGVCYGWFVTNNFDATPDVGSSAHGPGVPLLSLAQACKRGYVRLSGSIDYSCDSCDASDSATVSIDSSIPNRPTVGDLESLGLNANDLAGDQDDTTLINMVNALPLLVADRGIAPYIAYEPATDVPAADRATGKPGSDLMRDTWPILALFGALLLGGPAYYFYKRAQKGK